MKLSRLSVSLLMATALAVRPAAAQAPAQTTPPLAVGALAPDFAIPGATRFGVLQQPVKLSDYRGKTVVLAFFPQARTRGCTVQMRAYRDQYAELFRDGQDVVLIAISADPVEELNAWARDEQFQFLFVSDRSTKVAQAFGAVRSATMTNRNLFIIGPDGKIAYTALPFREVDPTAYEELNGALAKVIRTASR